MLILRVPINHPHWSSDMSVLVKDAAKSVVSANIEAHVLLWIDHRLGQRAQRRGLPEGPMGSMPVVELLELA
jgi:hypothetical protein